MRKARTTVAAALTIAVVSLGVVGCATADRTVSAVASPEGSGSGRGAAMFAGAALTADEVTTGRYEVTTTVSGDESLSATATGSFDAETRSIEFTSSLGSQAANVSIRLVDGIFYVQLGSMGELFGVDTEWVSLDVAALASEYDLNLEDLGGSPSTDPLAFMDLLRGYSGEVTDLGAEEVRGVPTRHLRADVIPALALADLAPDRQDAIRDLVGDVIDTPIPVDVWVDDAGMLRKGAVSYDLEGVGNIDVTFELFDLGEPVAIAAPPAGDVTAAEDLPILEGLLGGD